MNELLFAASAFILGGLHAIEPGHGKTVVAAYLVGSKGRVSDAILLGGVVTFTHTISIIILGLLTAVAAAYLVPETVHEVLAVVSGLLVLGVGLWMVNERIVKGRTGHDHDHSHGHDHDSLPHSHQQTLVREQEPVVVSSPVFHTHDDGSSHSHSLPSGTAFSFTDLAEHQAPGHGGFDLQTGEWHAHEHLLSRDDDHAEHEHRHSLPTHDHDHDGYDHPGHEHIHPQHEVSHAPHPEERPSLGGLVALGISGGIVPCPAALALLLAAVGAGNILGGVSLVVVFSLGLAAVLIAIGITIVKAADFATRRFGDRLDGNGTLARGASVASAVVVTLLGVFLTAQAFVEVVGMHV